MKAITLKRLKIVIGIGAMVWLISSCLYILTIVQPSTANVNETITAVVNVEMDETPCDCPGGGPSAGLAAIMIPTDWTIDQVEYDGDYGPEFMNLLHPDSADIQPGSGTDFWYDSLAATYPPPAGMDWFVFEGPVTHGWVGNDTTNVSVTFTMTTGAAGQYDIGYFVSTTDYNFGVADETDMSLGNTITVGAVGIEENPLPGIAERFALEQNFPNPFNPETKIRYSITQRSDVQLAVYNMAGQLVATLSNGIKAPGKYEVTFEAEDLASGVYLYRLSAGSFVETRKMMLVR